MTLGRLLWIVVALVILVLGVLLFWLGPAESRPMMVGPQGELITPPCCLVEWQYCAGRFVLGAYLKAQKESAAVTTCQGCGERVMQDEPGFVRRDHPDLPFFCYGCNKDFDEGLLHRVGDRKWIKLDLGEQ